MNTFPVAAEIQIYKIDIRPASDAVFVSIPDRGGTIAERFFVRSGNSSQELTANQTQRFTKERF